jgi:hypothetical protein
MPSIASLCDRILAQHDRIGSDLRASMNPGLSRSGIAERMSEFSFRLPDSIVEMYMWHNGTNEHGNGDFYPWWVFDPLEISCGRYKTLAAPNANPFWNERWFPILSAPDISSVGIECAAGQTVDGKIASYEYMLGSGVLFLSLETMLLTILGCFETGAIFLGADRSLDYDFEEFKPIANRHNPGLKTWK